MPKRFTSTEKWDDPWFRKLKPEYKSLWDYLYCQCDNSGVWRIDWEDASFRVGYSITTGSIEILNEGKKRLSFSKCGIFLIIKDYIKFQVGDIYQEKLTNLQKNCISLVDKHVIERRFKKEDFLFTGSLRVNYEKTTGESNSKSNSKSKSKSKELKPFSSQPPKNWKEGIG